MAKKITRTVSIPVDETFTKGNLRVLGGGDGQCHAIVDKDFRVVSYVGIRDRPNVANACLYAEANKMYEILTKIVAAVEKGGTSPPNAKRLIGLAKKSLKTIDSLSAFSPRITPQAKRPRKAKEAK